MTAKLPLVFARRHHHKQVTEKPQKPSLNSQKTLKILSKNHSKTLKITTKNHPKNPQENQI
jgi:hypothetical protein